MRHHRPTGDRAPDPVARAARARGLRRLLVAAFLAGGSVAEADGTDSLALTAEHQRRLAAGEIVVLDARPPGASPSAGGGTAVALVQAPVERVWAVLTDYPGHPRYYPGVETAEVLEASGPRVLVRYTVRIGFFSFSFHMNKVADPARRRIEWHLAEDRANGLLRENSGYWQVEARPGGSRVTYAIAVRSYLPGFLTAGSERNSLVETVTGLRRVVAGAPGRAGSLRRLGERRGLVLAVARDQLAPPPAALALADGLQFGVGVGGALRQARAAGEQPAHGGDQQRAAQRSPP
jgi:ribosome-associated toxin RatA of RatAB toxin-antitoxin module